MLDFSESKAFVFFTKSTPQGCVSTARSGPKHCCLTNEHAPHGALMVPAVLGGRVATAGAGPS
jgi:hypothetical protein